MKQAQISLAARYVEKIRNQKKRAYAVRYFNYKRGTALEPEDDGGLTFMGAQAVRLQLDSLLS